MKRPRVRWLVGLGFAVSVVFADEPRRGETAEIKSAVTKATSADPAPTSTDLGSYAAIGSLVAEKIRLTQLHWTEDQFAAFMAGLQAGYTGRGYPFDEKARQLFEEMNRLMEQPEAPQPGRSAAEQLASYMKQARESAGLRQTESGLLHHVIVAGAGPRPRPDDVVVINLLAKGPDGTTEVPELGGQNLRTKVSDLLPGLREGVQLMALGGHALFVVPPQLTFTNDRWTYGVDRNLPIWYQVELEDIEPQRP